MSTPLGNSIRSFWTPEVNRDPEWLRLVRIDKAALVGLALALLFTASALIACVIGIAWTLTR